MTINLLDYKNIRRIDCNSTAPGVGLCDHLLVRAATWLTHVFVETIGHVTGDNGVILIKIEMKIVSWNFEQQNTINNDVNLFGAVILKNSKIFCRQDEYKLRPIWCAIVKFYRSAVSRKFSRRITEVLMEFSSGHTPCNDVANFPLLSSRFPNYVHGTVLVGGCLSVSSLQA